MRSAFALSILLPLLASGQEPSNLLRDPGFEIYKGCPVGPSEVSAFKHWESPTRIEAGAFARCRDESGPVRTPLGDVIPAEGNAFAGFRATSRDFRRSYLRAELQEPLERGVRYRAGFLVRLAAGSGAACDGPGIWVTRRLFDPASRQITATPVVVPERGDVVDNAKGWRRMEAAFLATGDERWVLLGNFHPRRSLTMGKGPGTNDYAYYFVDSVWVTRDSTGWEGGLVVNGGFEGYASCPNDRDDLPLAEGWNAGPFWRDHPGTADLFAACSRHRAGFRNDLGEAQPWSGRAYAGINLYSRPGAEDWAAREYLQGRFHAPLRAGARYCVRLRTSLGDASKHAVDALAVYLSPTGDPPPNYAEGRVLEHPAQLRSGRVLRGHRGWTCLAWEYVADGGERFLTIGNFDADGAFEIGHGPGPGDFAYYYFDGVEVDALTPGEPCECEAPPGLAAVPPIGDRVEEPAARPVVPEVFADWAEGSDIDSGTVFVLRNIRFAFDRIDLSDAAREELDRLAGLLAAHPELRIELRGHTDRLGSFAYNLDLSRRRAISVRDGLVARGTNPDRLDIAAFAYLLPLEDRDDSAGRAINRRVEFRVLNSLRNRGAND